MENVYEQLFQLKYRGHWGFHESYSLSVGLRKWFVERLNKQLEDEEKELEKIRKKGKSKH